MHESLESGPTELNTSASIEQVVNETSTVELGDAALNGITAMPEVVATVEDLHSAVTESEKQSVELADRINTAAGNYQPSLANTLFKELGKSEAELQSAKDTLAAHLESNPESAELLEALQAAADADAKADAIADKMSGADSGTVRALSYSLEAAENDLLAARVKIFDLKNADGELPPEVAELDAEYKKYSKMVNDAMHNADDPKESYARPKRDEAKKALDRKKANIAAAA